MENTAELQQQKSILKLRLPRMGTKKLSLPNSAYSRLVANRKYITAKMATRITRRGASPCSLYSLHNLSASTVLASPKACRPHLCNSYSAFQNFPIAKHNLVRNLT